MLVSHLTPLGGLCDLMGPLESIPGTEAASLLAAWRMASDFAPIEPKMSTSDLYSEIKPPKPQMDMIFRTNPLYDKLFGHLRKSDAVVVDEFLRSIQDERTETETPPDEAPPAQ